MPLLSSFFPGFRNFRTPVLVGALWCAVLWIVGQSQFASQTQSVGEFVAGNSLLRWKDFAPLALVGTFVAYVVGVAATLDPTRGVTGWVLGLVDRRRNSAKVFAAGSTRRQEEVRELLAGANTDTKHKFDEEAAAARYNHHRTLKLRLRPHQEEVFLDCDKLDAEASVRLSSAFPLIVGSILGWNGLDEPLFGIGVVVAVVLLLRGVGRAMEARDTAREAVLAGLVAHPLVDVIANFGFKPASPASDSDETAGVS
jgi:hypothetical protein